MFIQTSNTATGALVGEKLYYTHTDFQGSLTALTNEDGTVAERYAYNPWGARRNPTDWTQTDARTSLITDRGYTGHEHIDLFRVINMNGRVYDPTTAQFLSPDPMLQAPGDWLNYNRYTYCMNNPLKYTDPSGYEAYPGPAWYDSSLGGWRYLDAYNQMHVISGGEVQEINSRAMAARNGTLRYQTSEVQESSRYLTDAPGPGSAFDEYCGKLDYIQRYGSDLYKAAKESGAITSQSYTDFITNTLLKADFSSGFLKIANYITVDGFIGGIVNKDGKLYGKTLISMGAMAAHVSDTYITLPGQSAGQGSGEGSGYGDLIGPALIALGQPINALKPIGALGSKPGSSIASYTLSKMIPQTFTKTLGKEIGTKVATSIGTNVMGRALGRLVPYIGWGLTAIDLYNNRTSILEGFQDFGAGAREFSENNGVTYYVCFAKGTLVLLENGQRPIEQIIVGDFVYSYNFEKDTVELCKVMKTFENRTKEIFEITTNHEKIMVTAQHPFYVKNKGWIKVKDLRINDILTSKAHHGIQIKDIKRMTQSENVYNIEVEGNHNYFVTNSAILVHNK